DYRTVVLAPASVQEMFDLTADAFRIADEYRVVVLILADAHLGQMMEPVLLPDEPFPPPPPKPWALTGCKDREPNVIKSLYLGDGELEQHNYALQRCYQRITAAETRAESVAVDDADVVLVAYGTCARTCREAVAVGREAGHKIGLVRPITLWPFPVQAILDAAASQPTFLSVEMSLGQMAEDIRLTLEGRCPLELLGRPAAVPEAAEIVERAVGIIQSSSR
ncbi:3-methyl-2-oxobutanoate dehydrogenase subunit beta, partial [bacterium]|nr:3-methyl-2-oxobutanoate dehydrogenase subunit beta [bacterium]